MQNEEVSHFLRNHSLGAGHFGGKRGSGFGFVTVFIRQKNQNKEKRRDKFNNLYKKNLRRFL